MTADRTGGRGASPAVRGRAQAAALTVVGAFVAWMALGWAGGALGWPIALAFVFDAACLAALGWALVTLLHVWRSRRQEDKGR